VHKDPQVHQQRDLIVQELQMRTVRQQLVKTRAIQLRHKELNTHRQKVSPGPTLLLNLDMGAAGRSANGAPNAPNPTLSGSAGSQGLLRNGLNPVMRGYSPSKPYWKQGGTPVLSKNG
jgi:hypothetical protein